MSRDQRIWEAGQQIKAPRARITDPGDYFILKPT
jgi:hypothetical protein